MTYSGFQGTTTDPTAIHNKMNFTTKDSDKDSHVRINCAIDTSWSTTGGWRYKNCVQLQIMTTHMNQPQR